MIAAKAFDAIGMTRAVAVNYLTSQNAGCEAFRGRTEPAIYADGASDAPGSFTGALEVAP